MRSILVAALALATATPAAATDSTPPGFAPLAEEIRRTHAATGHPFGAAINVVKDGEVLYEGYFGYRDLQDRLPVTADTTFYIASATKPFLALGTLLHEHHGRLDTGMPLQQMFPDVRFKGFDADQVTIRDLLTHTSGIDNLPLAWATAFTGLHDAESRYRLVAASAPDGEAARGTFNYTNVGYNLLSVWLEERFSTPWQDQLDAAIFQPLGMQRTSGYISEAEAGRWPLARPYSFASAEPGRALYLSKADSTMQAAGGLVATAPDLAEFLLAQLSAYGPGRDPPRDNAPIPAAVIEQSHAVQAMLDDAYGDFERTGYAWGWYSGTYKQRRMLHHFGGFAGFHAHLSFMPEEGVGLVVLANDDHLGSKLAGLIADYVYSNALGQAHTAADVGERFDELRAGAVDFRKRMLAHRDAIQARPWRLTLPHAAYDGTYSHAEMGEIVVTGEKAGMQVQWGRLAAMATGHEQQDHVRVEWIPNTGHVLSFQVDGGVSVALEFRGTRFRRRP